MYKWLGYISVALVILLTAPYWLRKINGCDFQDQRQTIF